MEVHDEYRICKIPKGRRSFRTIYIPSERLKDELRVHLPYLLHRNLTLDTHRACQAFIKGRNCVTNALQHVGYKHTVSLDLRDFFDSVRPDHVEGKIAYEVIKKCFIDSAPRQGLPTSPLIANIALISCDEKIIKAIEQQSCPFAYTRYADDICISLDDEKVIPKVNHIVSSVLTSQGFELNMRKTRIQHQANGRRIITGIGVDNEGLHPTRATRKKLRAAMHQENWSSALGLVEWSKCKLPGHSKRRAKDSYRHAIDSKIVSCSCCGEDDLMWFVEDGRRHVLVDFSNRVKHVCSKLPRPISAQDVMLSLRQLDFEEFLPKSKTWTIGYFKILNRDSLFVLFRKSGIDLGLHERSITLQRDAQGHVSLSGKVTHRYSYDKEIDHVNQLVTEMITSYCSVPVQDDLPF